MTAIARPGGYGDDRLVAAARRGDDRAFETLYARYHDRIGAYVLTRVKDHGRAEDVTQEVFVSALRAIRGNHGPFAFEPWLYRIARNACIDQYHRSQRSEEVSFDVDDSGVVVGSAPTPDSALIAKQDLHHLWGAFGDLSDTCHEVLVLREFEGLSYAEIGERLGMSRGAVETSLLRGRRRLAEEYAELATGARCRRTQQLIPVAAADGLGKRELHRLARHVSHCQPCRRDALAAGMDPAVLTAVPLRRRAAAKIAALFPLPGLARVLRGRERAEEAVASLAPHAPQLSEPLHAGWAKAAALAAVLIAGAGAGGVGTRIAADANGAPEPRTRSAPERSRAVAEPVAAGTVQVAAQPVPERRRARRNGARDRGGSADRRRRGRERRAGDGSAPGADPTIPPAPQDVPAGEADDRGGERLTAPATDGGDETIAGGGSGDANAGSGSGDANAGGGSSPDARAVDLPASSTGRPLINGVSQTVAGTVGGVGQTVDGAAQGVNQTLQGLDQGLGETLGGVNQTLAEVTGGLGQTVQDATQGLDETLAGVGALLGPRHP